MIGLVGFFFCTILGFTSTTYDDGDDERPYKATTTITSTKGAGRTRCYHTHRLEWRRMDGCGMDGWTGGNWMTCLDCCCCKFEECFGVFEDINWILLCKLEWQDG